MLKLNKRAKQRMTVVVAAMSGNGTVVGADSCTTIGNRKLVKMINGSKLVQFDNFVVGLSGIGPLREILDLMLSEPLSEGEEADDYDWKKHRVNCNNDVSKFLEKFMDLFQDLGDAESMGTVELLVVTKDKIFCTMGESTVFQVKDFWSVGSGSDYAMGVLDTVHTPDMSKDNLLSIVSQSIETACKFADGCQPPVELIVLG